MVFESPLEPVRWKEGKVRLIDQRVLPGKLEFLDIDAVEDLSRAVETLAVRGAPAIGIAAAYGVVLGARNALRNGEDPRDGAQKAIERLRRTRPTAVNLFHDLDRMTRVLENTSHTGVDLPDALLDEAHRILEEDLETGRRIAAVGLTLFPEKPSVRVLTHCNAGGLATGGWGTALAPIYEAKARGKEVLVFADETRPLLQGSRLTAWELSRAGIPVRVLVDGAAAWVLDGQGIDLVIVGADRIAVNGDTANKIGTRSVALAARDAGVPFYVAAPLSTFDVTVESGADIPVEQRGGGEVMDVGLEGVQAMNPAFDVTPARLISGWITDRGLLEPPFSRERLKAARTGEIG